ncbi:MAG: DUF433 domain-containing protein [Planctomycetia bacterium]|nr:MAG: DUF433 domain-containing protein [Planctomycetia bacterium]
MEEKKILQRISSDPDICHGKPCIKGTRIPVYLIVSLIAELSMSHKYYWTNRAK